MSWEEAWGKDDSYYKLSLHFCLFYKVFCKSFPVICGYCLLPYLLLERTEKKSLPRVFELKSSRLTSFYRQDLRPEEGSEGTPCHAAS